MLRTVIGLSALIVSSQGLAADWVEVATAMNGTRVYLDASSISQTGDYRVTWEKYVYAKPEARGASFAVDRNRYNCSTRTVTALGNTLYANDGSVVDSNHLSTYEQQADDVVPDSLGEAVFDLICK